MCSIIGIYREVCNESDRPPSRPLFALYSYNNGCTITGVGYQRKQEKLDSDKIWPAEARSILRGSANISSLAISRPYFLPLLFLSLPLLCLTLSSLVCRFFFSSFLIKLVKKRGGRGNWVPILICRRCHSAFYPSFSVINRLNIYRGF